VLADLTESRAAAVYAALAEFERLAELVPSAPGLDDRMALAEAMADRQSRYRSLLDAFGGADELMRGMTAAAPALDGARRRVESSDWWEGVAAAALCAPLTDELFGALLGGDDDGHELGLGQSAAVEIAAWAQQRLRTAIDRDPVLAARIAMWGRRLLGEAIVLCREFGGERYAELADRLAASHARRLTALGPAELAASGQSAGK
jgi:tRNA-(MS[2]IO[6]A)-hydroxylase (MiaE)-like